MKIMNLNKDVYAGIILTIAGFFFFSETNKMNPQSALFPKIVIVAFIIFAVVMSIEGLKKSKKNISENIEDPKITLNGIKIPMTVFLFITAYVIGLKFIGFYISTLLFMPALMLFYKNRNIGVLIGSTLGTIIFLHLLIVVKLKLMLP